jgi:hypothetical protein
MLEESSAPAITSRGHAGTESGISLSRPLTCDRKPNGNRQIQVNRGAMLDISKLPCQGNFRKPDPPGATHEGIFRAPTSWLE